MSCTAKIKNRWSRKNWSWQTHLSFLFALIVVIVPLRQIPSFCQQGNKLQDTHGYRLPPALRQSGVIFQWWLAILQQRTKYCFSKLMSAGQEWVCVGSTACRRLYYSQVQPGSFVHGVGKHGVVVNISRIKKKGGWSQIVKRKNSKSFFYQVTWESKVPHKAPLPQYSLTHKHKDHLLDSQFRSERENPHFQYLYNWIRCNTAVWAGKSPDSYVSFCGVQLSVIRTCWI